MEKIENLIKILNHQLESDKDAIQDLLNMKVSVNNKLADDPFIRVDTYNNLSLIGYINNILNILELPNICVKYSDNGKLIGFAKYD